MKVASCNESVTCRAILALIAVTALVGIDLQSGSATTIFERSVKCLVCGETHKYKSLSSTNRFGYPDLDTRPPEMFRSTMHMWVQCCPSCGYCASRVSEGPLAASEIGKLIRYKRYVEQRSNSSYPELANKFLCRGMIKDAAKDHAGAGWSALRAAWACDDVKAGDAASDCRKEAIRQFQLARSRGQSFARKPGEEEAILADLYRRTGQFDQVTRACDAGLSKNPGDLVKTILNLQKRLALEKDQSCHKLGEAVDPASKPQRSSP